MVLLLCKWTLLRWRRVMDEVDPVLTKFAQEYMRDMAELEERLYWA
jgi:succinate dehydrogenase flavin-adding protein (antitoxin of CptAB toxin-antitoxin module)